MRNTEKIFRVLGGIGQWVGLLTVLVAFGLMVSLEASPFFSVFTGGSLIWGISTKIKYYRGKKRVHHIDRVSKHS